VVEPAVSGLALEGTPFQGILYTGLMLTSEGPIVLEFNARLGDPEAQVVLPRLSTDLVEILEAMAQSRLDRLKIEWDAEAALCVVMATQGYPENPRVGDPIDGLDEAERMDKVVVFHSGTVLRDGHLFTSGGRVFGVTAYGQDLAAAREQAYASASRIRFQGMHYRLDIGLKALQSSSDRAKERTG
jgi:phosphoribosylamine--glycine ligase